MEKSGKRQTRKESGWEEPVETNKCCQCVIGVLKSVLGVTVLTVAILSVAPAGRAAEPLGADLNKAKATGEAFTPDEG